MKQSQQSNKLRFDGQVFLLGLMSIKKVGQSQLG
ncbi:hypothetical protein Calab_2253 [Caldithrix abyssi DSM 13497]|uniref:Uncharacterized protein n=1 Tax=Caldithrix abyssi DSM 13497 TaxID=880073 RepID=H1XWM5_CALAY|nr:hypothetical protein Calab_2253 [Caldithrix abyssi DSM 13497]